MINIPYVKQYVDGELINPIVTKRVTRGLNRSQRRKILKDKKRR